MTSLVNHQIEQLINIEDPNEEITLNFDILRVGSSKRSVLHGLFNEVRNAGGTVTYKERNAFIRSVFHNLEITAPAFVICKVISLVNQIQHPAHAE